MDKKFLKLFSREISGERTFRYLNLIAQHHRIQASPGFRDAAITCQEILAQNGLQADIISYPADGKSRFLASQALLEWKASKARLELIQEKETEILADYEHSELSVIQRLGSTPPQGAEGPIVRGDKKDELPPIKGKWLLTRAAPETVRSKVIKEKGLGIIYDGMPALPPVREEGGLPHNRQYTSFWGLNENENPPGFVLTPAQGKKIRAKLEKGEKVSARGFAKTSFYSGNFENLSLLFPGEKEEEILLIAHLCHPRPSAGDNASGSAVLLEIATALKKLLGSGEIPPLKYSIRLLWVPEMTGTYAYLASRVNNSPRILAALNLDMVGQKQEVGGGSLIVENPPLASASWGADLLQSILKNPYFHKAQNPYQTASFPGFTWRTLPFSGGSDHYILSDPTVDIPCPMLIQWPDRHYHTDADHPGTIDPLMLHNVGCIAATYASFLAALDPAGLEFLAKQMFASFAAEISSRLSGGQLTDKKLDWLLEKKLEHLQDLNRFKETFDTTKYIESLRQIALSFAPLAEKEKSRNFSREKLLPKRLVPGPPDQRFFQRELEKANLKEKFEKICKDFGGKNQSAKGYATNLLYWVDGKRTFEEVVENTYWETGIESLDFAFDYFRLLEEIDLLELNRP